MGKGRKVKLSRSNKETAAGHKAPEADPDEWLDSLPAVDDIPRWALLRYYGAATACTRAHKEDCGTPLCFRCFKRPSQRQLTTKLLGTTPPDTRPDPADGTQGWGEPRGLINLGNTCYMNAVIQLLFHTPELTAHILATPSDAATVRAALVAGAPKVDAVALHSYGVPVLFARLALANRDAVNPSLLTNALSLDTSVQQDAQEFLALFLGLLTDVSSTLAVSLRSSFGGTDLYTRTCDSCGHVTLKADPILFTTVPVAPSLADALAAMRVPEAIEGATCEGCGQKVTMHTTHRLKAVPRRCVLHLLRFQYDLRRGERVKDNTAVDVPMTLSAATLSGDPEDTRTYRLTAVVDHVGRTPEAGHYVAHVAGSEGWVCLNDDEVSPSRAYGAGGHSKEAYLVVYSLDEGDDDDTHDPTPTVCADLKDAVLRENAEAAVAAATFTETRGTVKQRAAAWDKVCGEALVAPDAMVGALPHDAEDDMCSADEVLRFVPHAWLEQVACGDVCGLPSSEVALRSHTLLCPHGRCDPAGRYKFLSVAASDALVAEFGAEGDLLDTTRHLCSECTAPLIAAKARGRVSARQQALLRESTGTEHGGPGGVFVARSFVDDLRGARSFEAVADRDVVRSLTCPHGGLAPNVAKFLLSEESLSALHDWGFTGPGLPGGTAECTDCIEQHRSTAMEAHGALQEKLRAKRELQFLYAHDSNRSAMQRDIANYTKQHRRRWQEEQDAKRKAAGPPPPRKARSPLSSPADTDPKKRARHDAATPSPEPEVCPDRRQRWELVPLEWADRLRAWINDKDGCAPPPRNIDYGPLLCPHGACIDFEDLHPARRRGGQPMALLVTQEHLAALRQRFTLPDVTPGLVELNDKRTIEPGTCRECTTLRRDTERRALELFSGATFCVAGRVKLSKKQSREVQSVLQGISCEALVDDLCALVAADVCRETGMFVAASSITLQKGRITLCGQTTLREAGVWADDTLSFVVTDMLRAVAAAAEVSFQNSELVQAVRPVCEVGTVAGKACGLCTFENSPDALTCEMCESLL